MRSSSMCEASVLVVGSGPAGAAAAIWCAQRGLDVLLIEKASFPRHRPGETLHPGVEPLLAQLGVKEAVLGAGFLRHSGYKVRWEDSQSRFVSYGQDATGPWQGFQAWRATFDAILMDRAVEAGVRVIQPCAARSLLTQNGRVLGVNTGQGKIAASFVIDATGDGHWLRRQMRLETRTVSPRLVVSFGYCQGPPTANFDLPGLEADGLGWSWIAPVKAGICSWTRLNFSSSNKLKIPEKLCSAKLLSPSGGANVTWRQVTPVAGPGFFVVGDAAVVLDPASSHGILRALMSGIK